MFSFDKISDVTNPSELIKANFMGGSRTAVYNLFNCEGFPAFKIGKRLYISKEKLRSWIDQQTSPDK